MTKINIHNCQEELKESSLKVTPARLAVLKLLEAEKNPVDVHTIISSLKRRGLRVDPVTIFRIVNLFSERGLTRQIQLNEGKTRYEISSREDHHHLICQNCQSIEDVSDCSIFELEKEIEKKKRFVVKSHSLEFFGLCKKCQH